MIIQSFIIFSALVRVLQCSPDNCLLTVTSCPGPLTALLVNGLLMLQFPLNTFPQDSTQLSPARLLSWP